jgi:histidinol-phosphate aminotransferase
MKISVSEGIKNAKLYPPGKPIEEVRRKYCIDNFVKLNSNENCLGPSPMALKAIAEASADIHRYPDNSAYYLKNRLAEKCGVSPEQIILGNGSNEIVQFIIMTFLLQGEEVLTAKPTFLLYSIMSRVLGGKVKEIPLKDFSYDLESMANEIQDNTKLIFISNPNNPTGTIVNRNLFQLFIEKIPDNVLLVMDEAYFDFVTANDFPDTLDYIKQKKNIILLRTFSKAYGLAGLRIGYAVGPSELINYMDRVREPFNANFLAQRAALAAIDDTEHYEITMKNNRAGISYFYSQFQRIKLSYVPTQANFILVNVGPKADTVYQRLLEEGVMVRFMSDFGLNDYIRVTIGLPDENRKFIETLEKVLEGLE